MAFANRDDGVVVTGFDLAAKRIEEEILSYNPTFLRSIRLEDVSAPTGGASPSLPQNASSTTDESLNASHVSSRSANSTSPSVRENEKQLRTMTSNFGRLINSQFQKGLGRQKTPNTAASSEGASSTSSRVDSQRRSGRKRKSMVDAPVPISEYSPIASMQRGFPTESASPPHQKMPHSTLSPYYKRLLPSQIVRLSDEDEIIVVVPTLSKDTPAQMHDSVKYMVSKFDRLLMSSLVGVPASQKKEELLRLKRTHQRAHYGKVAHEYCCRVKNFPERAHLAHSAATPADVNLVFDADAGLNVEIFKLVRSGELLNSDLSFPESGDTDEPLLRQLWLVRGCTHSSIELMMKYYQESSE